MSLPNFDNQDLLDRALTHKSALHEQASPSLVSNERLEFLGDAVLELASTEYLFNRYTEETEGILTAYRSALVRTSSLAKVARELKLGEMLYMSKGEESSGGRENESILENTFEAVVGAIYLDQGYQAARDFLESNLFPYIDQIRAKKLYKDAKTNLQEIVQASTNFSPEYKTIKETGPDHDKIFTVEVSIDGQVMGQGSGRSKQTAQQAAAKQALIKMDQT